MQIVKIQKFLPVTPFRYKMDISMYIVSICMLKSILMKVVIIIITMNVFFSYQNSNKLKETDCEFAVFFVFFFNNNVLGFHYY